MGQSSALPRESAKAGSVKSGPSRGQKVHHILPFELFLREIWPQDRIKNYMRVTGAPERTAKRRAKSPPHGYEEFVALLRSDFGLQFLEHVLGDEPPDWFKGFKRAKHIGDMRRRQAQLQRDLAQIEMQIE